MRISRHKPSVAVLVLGAATALAFSSVSAQTSGRTVRPVDDVETKSKPERVTAPTVAPEAVTRPTSVVGTPAVPQHSAPSRSPEQAATGAGMGRGPSAKEAATVGAGRTTGGGSTPNPVGQGPAIELAAPPAVTTPDVPRTVDARPPGQPSAADLKKRQVKPPVQVQVLDAPPTQAYLPILEPQDQQQTQQQGLTSSSASQTQRFVAVGPPYLTGLSGEAGGIRTTVDLYSPGRPGPFIDTVKWTEKSNRPCHVLIFGTAVTTDYRTIGKAVYEGVVFGCNHTFIWEEQIRTVNTDESRPVASIRVCNNNRNNLRMKGIQVSGRHINPSDTSAMQPDISDVESLPNCKRWGQTRSCPANMRATGLVVHAKDAGGDDKAGITGLELICREVAVR